MTGKAVKVLIVEDNDDDFEATLRALNLSSDSDLGICRCNNATDAWNELLFWASGVKHITEDRKFFVILDLNMPGFDGRGLLARIKSHEQIKSIPVAVLSTSDDLRYIEACYRAGANAFIRKSVNWDEFVQKMSSLPTFWFRNAELPTLGARHEIASCGRRFTRRP